ncbi:MAG: hypothetical protein KAH57_07150 [Thermoplasmata archaeon]|nr:hypothetical protein [Thermoplasmata archaeon]
MTRITIPAGSALMFFCLALVIVFNSGDVQAVQPVDNMAIIIVSENAEASELGKAASFYGHLLNGGYCSDNVLFLTPSSVPGSDGTSNLSNIEDGFGSLVEDNETDKDVVIYISDHCGGCIDGAIFEFSNGTLNVSTIDGWIDDMTFDDLTFIIGGDRSGLAGPELEGDDRVIISSMGSDEMSTPDRFNITRGLESAWADFNNDGHISYIEAFISEKIRLLLEPQTPRLWA